MTTAQAAAPAAAPAPASAPAAAPSAAAPAAAPSAAPAAAPAADPNTPAASGQPGATGEDGKGGPNDAGAQVPEKYELAAPEGVELDTVAVDEFSAVAKDLKLSNEQAQKLAGVAFAMQQRQLAEHAKMVKGWEDAVKADKDIGGDNLQANLAVAKKALDTFGSKELVEVLNATGMGNHPEVIRAFHRIGKEISEGRFIASGSRTGTPTSEQTLASRLYPNLK